MASSSGLGDALEARIARLMQEEKRKIKIDAAARLLSQTSASNEAIDEVGDMAVLFETAQRIQVKWRARRDRRKRHAAATRIRAQWVGFRVRKWIQERAELEAKAAAEAYLADLRRRCAPRHYKSSPASIDGRVVTRGGSSTGPPEPALAEVDMAVEGQPELLQSGKGHPEANDGPSVVEPGALGDAGHCHALVEGTHQPHPRQQEAIDAAAAPASTQSKPRQRPRSNSISEGVSPAADQTMLHDLRMFFDSRYRVHMVRTSILRRMEEEGISVVEMFDKIDEDGSGELAKDELQGLFDELAVTVKQMEIEAIMKQIDKDGSGSIEVFEFQQWLTTSRDDWLTMRRIAPRDQYNDRKLLIRESMLFDFEIKEAIGKLWSMTDLDKSGSLSREEYLILHVMLQMNLIPDFQEQEAIELAAMEWEFDRQGHDVLDKRRFTLSMFQLLDQWRVQDEVSKESMLESLKTFIKKTTYFCADGSHRWRWIQENGEANESVQHLMKQLMPKKDRPASSHATEDPAPSTPEPEEGPMELQDLDKEERGSTPKAATQASFELVDFPELSADSWSEFIQTGNSGQSSGHGGNGGDKARNGKPQEESSPTTNPSPRPTIPSPTFDIVVPVRCLEHLGEGQWKPPTTPPLQSEEWLLQRKKGLAELRKRKQRKEFVQLDSPKKFSKWLNEPRVSNVVRNMSYTLADVFADLLCRALMERTITAVEHAISQGMPDIIFSAQKLGFLPSAEPAKPCFDELRISLGSPLLDVPLLSHGYPEEERPDVNKRTSCTREFDPFAGLSHEMRRQDAERSLMKKEDVRWWREVRHPRANRARSRTNGFDLDVISEHPRRVKFGNHVFEESLGGPAGDVFSLLDTLSLTRSGAPQPAGGDFWSGSGLLGPDLLRNVPPEVPGTSLPTPATQFEVAAIASEPKRKYHRKKTPRMLGSLSLDMSEFMKHTVSEFPGLDKEEGTPHRNHPMAVPDALSSTTSEGSVRSNLQRTQWLNFHY